MGLGSDVFFPHFRCGVVRFSTQIFSSPGTFVLARSSPRSSLECEMKQRWDDEREKSEMQQRERKRKEEEMVATARETCVKAERVPNPRVSRSAQPQRVPGVPNPRVLLECPNPECPWSAQPQNVPGVPNHRLSLECPTPVASKY